MRVYGDSKFTCVGQFESSRSSQKRTNNRKPIGWWDFIEMKYCECSSVERLSEMEAKIYGINRIRMRVRLSSDDQWPHTSQPYHWHEWIKMDGVPYLMPTDMAHNSTIGRCRWDAIWNINVMNELRSCSFLMSNSLPAIWNIHICTHTNTHAHLPHPKPHSACD